MKKLLIVTTVPGTLDNILRGQPSFLSSKYSVYLATSAGAGVLNIEKNEQINIDVVPMIRGVNPFYDLCSIFKMVHLLRRIRPDVIHSFTPKAGLVSAIAAFLTQIPVRIHTFTGLIFPTQTGMKYFFLKWLDRLIVYLNTDIVCEGKGVKQQLTAAGFKDVKFNIIGNGNIAGVDLSYFNPKIISEIQREQVLSLCLSRESFKFVYVGRLNRDKGINELILAFERISSDVELLLVGALDKASPPDNNIFEKIETNSKITWLGFLDDIRPSLAAVNCLVLPSYREGFPNVVLQAGAMGLPCIVTDVPGSNEIITVGENGWIVKPKSVSELHETMEEVMNMDSSDLLSIKRNARENIEEKFDRSFYNSKLLNFYQSVIYET